MVSLTVKNDTATKISCAPGNLAAGQSSQCTATVEDTATEGAGVPAGNVGFAVEGAGSLSDSGSCKLVKNAGSLTSSCAVDFTPSGTGSPKITATYGGEPTHEQSAKDATVSVVDPTAAALACAPVPVAINAATTCTVTVTDSAPAPSAPAGRVTFTSDGQGAFANGAACTLAAAGAGKSSCQVAYTPSASGSGTHTIAAAYAGEAGHPAARATVAVAVAVTPPAPDTVIQKKPRKKTAARIAKFTFAADQAGARFECKLDKKAFQACKSPFTIKRLRNGTHTLQVRAVSSQGAVDASPAKYSWRVGRVVKRKKH